MMLIDVLIRLRLLELHMTSLLVVAVTISVMQ